MAPNGQQGLALGGESGWVHLGGLLVESGPVLDMAQAEERCPAGYVVRREDRVQRDAETWLVWQLICHPTRRE